MKKPNYAAVIYGRIDMKMKFTKLLTLLIIITPAICHATVIQIGFAGLVDSINDPYNLLEDCVQEDASMSGFYLYDSATPDSFPQYIDQGVYRHLTASYGMLLNMGNLTFQTDSTNPTNEEFEVDIWNKLHYDLYSVSSGYNLPLNDEVTVDSIGLSLQDLSGTAISSIELPLTPPDLSKWPLNNIIVSGGLYSDPPNCEDPTFIVYGHITDVWLIPEPATLLLVSIGGLIVRKRS